MRETNDGTAASAHNCTDVVYMPLFLYMTTSPTQLRPALPWLNELGSFCIHGKLTRLTQIGITLTHLTRQFLCTWFRPPNSDRHYFLTYDGGFSIRNGLVHLTQFGITLAHLTRHITLTHVTRQFPYTGKPYPPNTDRHYLTHLSQQFLYTWQPHFPKSTRHYLAHLAWQLFCT